MFFPLLFSDINICVLIKLHSSPYLLQQQQDVVDDDDDAAECEQADDQNKDQEDSGQKDGACADAGGFTEMKESKGKDVKGKKKGTKGKEDGDYAIMLDISKSMSTISNLAATTAGPSAQSRKIDSHELWAQLLADKIRLLKKKQAEQFKNKVDAMIIELLPDDSDD